MITETDYKGLTELSEKRYSKYYDWIKHLVLIASVLIGIIISLKSGKTEKGCEYLAYIIAISGFGIVILSGSVSLFSEISTLDKGRKLYADRLIEIKNGKTFQLPFETVDKSLFYTILEIICFSSFVVSMFSLIIYGILKA